MSTKKWNPWDAELADTLEAIYGKNHCPLCAKPISVKARACARHAHLLSEYGRRKGKR